MKRTYRDRLPASRGYASEEDVLESDFLLRRLLAGELEKVRDRLAAAAAASQDEERLREKFSDCLRHTASLRDEILPVPAEERKGPELSKTNEEKLLDFDLALLDKVEGLHSPLDALEQPSPRGMAVAELSVYGQGISDLRELFRQREKLLAGEA